MLTIGQLKKIIKDLPDNDLVLTNSQDHSYRHIYADYTSVLKSGCYYSQDHDIDLESEEKRINALIIG